MRLIIAALLALVLIPHAFAIGMSYSSSVLQEMIYKPGAIIEHTYYAIGHGEQEVAVYVGGEFAQYASYDKLVKIIGTLTPFTVTFRFPDKVHEPGLYQGDVNVAQIKASSGQIALLAGAQVPFTVRVLHPEAYIELGKFSVEPHQALGGEKIIFSLSATNYGEKTAQHAQAVVAVYSNDVLIDTLYSEEQNIASSEGTTFHATWKSKKNKVGQYKAVGHITYSGKETPHKEEIFFVGKETVQVHNYTRQLTNDSVNRFSLAVMSQWNIPIDFSAEVGFSKNNQEVAAFKTPTETLLPWVSRAIDGFVDTRGFALGKYGINITLFAGSKIMSVYPGTVMVIGGKPQVIFQEVTKAPMGVILVLVTLLVLLFIGNIVLIIAYKKKKR